MFLALAVLLGLPKGTTQLAWLFSSLIVLGVIMYVLARCAHNIFFHPLRHMPGPLLWRASDLPKIFYQCNGTIPFKLTELHEKYGDVVRIAPRELSYISAWAWKEIYGRRGGRPLPPNPAYGMREKELYGALSLLWVQDERDHSRQRQLLQENFSTASLRAFEPTILSHVDTLIQRMHERAGQTVDIARWLNYVTFDIIGNLTFGESFGCLREAKYHPWIAFIFSRLKMMMFGQIVLTMGIFGRIVECFVPRWIKDEALGHVRLTKSKVDKRRESPAAGPDFMTKILENVGIPDGMTLAELYANSQILVMAGSETSATVLAVAVYYLLREPDIMRKAVKEVRSFQQEAAISFGELASMQYLRAVISEALRIHPPLPAGINKIIPKGGAQVGNFFIPEGVSLQVPHWPAYHHSANFVDPYKFVPERWLNRDPRYASDNREVFQPFSMGPHNCVGRPLAFLETHMILARLLWHFDMELMPESEGWNRQRVFLLYEKKPLNVRLTPARKDATGQTGRAASC